MSYIESSIEIEQEPEKVYQLLKKLEDFPRFMPEVKSIKLLEQKGNTSLTEWQTEVDGITIIWKEEEIYDDPNLEVKYRLIEGDLDKFEGSWRLLPIPGGTKAVLGVDYDFGVPALADLMGPVLELKVKENSQAMLRALKVKSESLGR